MDNSLSEVKQISHLATKSVDEKKFNLLQKHNNNDLGIITQKDLLIPVKKICRGWCEIDTLNDYTYAKNFFKENQHQIINNEII